MSAENWIIPEDDDDWQAAMEDLNAALATPFTSKSRESTKPHHSKYSFLEHALAADGGLLRLLASFAIVAGGNLLNRIGNFSRCSSVIPAAIPARAWPSKAGRKATN